MSKLVASMQEKGLLNPATAGRVQALVAEGTPIEEAVLAADGVSEEALLHFLADAFDIPYIDSERLERQPPPKEFLAGFPAKLLLGHRILPIEQRNGVTLVATSRLSDTTALDELRLACGHDLALALAPSAEIDRCLKKTLGVGADTLQSLTADADSVLQVIDTEEDEDLDLANAALDSSIIKFVNQILTEAVDARATDVHIEPFEEQLRIRYRIDGVLQESNVPESVRRFHAAIVSRIKILSHLDIAEKRLPQDGRIKLKISGREIDVRVSIIPMIHGEAVVLRILDRGDAMLGTEHLGMALPDRNRFDQILEMPHGIVLVTGPTGSGKTTTLYAALSKINDIERKIITVEDPVEYQLRGVNQIQVSIKTGLTFAAGLRAILRHDPDVVLVGEIRDLETAEIAVQASLTGHLVFSTLHTNDAPGAATRLVDMGLEPYLVASSLEVVVAQRLVRVICGQCKQTVSPEEAAQARMQFGTLVPGTLYKGAGCRRCQGTGFRGRQGIFEMMAISDDIRSLILQRAPSHELRKIATHQGMRSLRDDGWRIVAEGRTTIDEVLRNTKDEEATMMGFTTGAESGRHG
ncbi:MAG TPA: ATPase, T2SS/T4P/T4SS family [Phycisphaerae bacterium]|nr:ATPase, T2SS/T4P/T4SS family [Phycisphaerae bacterium]HRY68897.1 ATPase, T2SS/T4P/T4SS family [Phycisphaerae bacterium]HSA25724.1 ATPase, T2SS/T4P/T4SS family [Phycisphaerae bacterium]